MPQEVTLCQRIKELWIAFLCGKEPRRGKGLNSESKGVVSG